MVVIARLVVSLRLKVTWVKPELEFVKTVSFSKPLLYLAGECESYEPAKPELPTRI